MTLPEHEASLDFVFWRHTEPNVEKMVETVESIDPDIILIEAPPTQEKKERRILEAIANLALGGELSRAHKGILRYEHGERALRMDYKHLMKFLPGIFKGQTGVDALLARFHDSEKNLYFTDVNASEHGDIVEDIKRMDTMHSELNKLKDGEETPLDDGVETPVAILKLFGKNIRERDEVSARQIEMYRMQFPDARIVAIYGNNHSGIYHGLSSSSPNVRRHFIDTTRLFPPPTRMVYPIESQISRSVRFNKLVSQELIDRLAVFSALAGLVLANAGMKTDEIGTIGNRSTEQEELVEHLANLSDAVVQSIDVTTLADLISLIVNKDKSYKSELVEIYNNFLNSENNHLPSFDLSTRQ